MTLVLVHSRVFATMSSIVEVLKQHVRSVLIARFGSYAHVEDITHIILNDSEYAEHVDFMLIVPAAMEDCVIEIYYKRILFQNVPHYLPRVHGFAAAAA